MLYRILLGVIGLGFAAFFAITVLPALATDWDVVAAFRAGFVNPFAAGFSADAILTWCVLAVWVVRDARVEGVRHGWVALLLGAVPGVATGLAVYLLTRAAQHAKTG